MPRFLLALPAMVLEFFAISAPAATDAAPKGSVALPHSTDLTVVQGYAEQLATKDFSGLMNKAVPASLPGMRLTFPLWTLMEYKNRAKFQELSYPQQLQLAGWIVPGEWPVDKPVPPDGTAVKLIDLFMMCSMFVHQHGRPPHGAAEIIAENLSYLPAAEAEKQLEVLLHGKQADYPRNILGYINPQTGKLYASFDGSVAEPGGLVFRKLEDPADINEALKAHNLGGTSADYSSVYAITVAAKNPAEILDTGIAVGHSDTQ